MQKQKFVKKIKTLVSLFLSLCLLASCLVFLKNVRVQAASYAKVIEVKLKDGQDATSEIQKALDEAAKAGTKKKQAMVKVPAGTYYINKTLVIGSNTYLKLDAKTYMKKSHNPKDPILHMLHAVKGKKGKFSDNSNITVQGGNWDADNNYHLYPGGGRVAVRLTDAGAIFAERWPANIQAMGVAWNAGDGTRLHHTSSGTVYLQDGTRGEGAGTVRIFQNNATVNWTTVCTNDFTAFPSTRHGGENDDLRRVALEIGGGAHVLVSVEQARANSLSIAEHSTLNLNGKTLTVKSAKLGNTKLSPGTYAAGDTAVAGFVTDSGAGGELVVTGGGFLLFVR